jgi:hypothetical protein
MLEKCWLGYLCLTILLYLRYIVPVTFFWWREPRYGEKTTEIQLIIDEPYYIKLLLLNAVGLAEKQPITIL